MGTQLPASEVNQVAGIIWSQIPVRDKMGAGCGKPRAIQEERDGEWMAGIQVAVNPVLPAGPGFEKVNERYNPNNPAYVIKVFLDYGPDTYIVERWKLKPTPIREISAADIYFDMLGEIFYRATASDLSYFKEP